MVPEFLLLVDLNWSTVIKDFGDRGRYRLTGAPSHIYGMAEAKVVNFVYR